MPKEQKTLVIKPDPSTIIEKVRPICQCKLTAIGVVLIIIGVFWFLKNIGVLSVGVFWPAILVIIGIACLLKAVKMCK